MLEHSTEGQPQLANYGFDRGCWGAVGAGRPRDPHALLHPLDLTRDPAVCICVYVYVINVLKLSLSLSLYTCICVHMCHVMHVDTYMCTCI